MKIFAGQSALRICVKTFCDLSDCVTAGIRYKKPDGTGGEFAAGVRDRENGVLVHECLSGEIDQAGWWVFWAAVSFADGRCAVGAAEKVFVWQEGK
jgi:hypothetical protein